MKKVQKFRDQSREELEHKQQELRSELYELANSWRMSKKLDHPHLLKQKKQEIAQILTILNEKNQEKKGA